MLRRRVATYAQRAYTVSVPDSAAKQHSDSPPSTPSGPATPARRPPKRDARLNLRVTAEVKALLEEAAAADDTTLSEFCITAARRAAEERLKSAETIRLRGKDAQVFFNALVRPPRPNAALRRAAKRHAQRVKGD